jgi:hypothetical protein
MSDQTDGKPAATGRIALQDDPHRYRIVPIGSGSQSGWAIEHDGKVIRTGDRIEALIAPARSGYAAIHWMHWTFK